MAKKQTAVDYFLKEISEILGIIEPNAIQTLLLISALDEARKMEKEQIKNSWMDGFKSSAEGWNGEMLPHYEDGKQTIDKYKEEYYYETYGKAR
jgi:hypothetical protein